jgi:hypothetical protein
MHNKFLEPWTWGQRVRRKNCYYPSTRLRDAKFQNTVLTAFIPVRTSEILKSFSCTRHKISGGTAPLILNFSTRYRTVASFKPWPLNSGKNSPVGLHIENGVGGPRVVCTFFENRMVSYTNCLHEMIYFLDPRSLGMLRRVNACYRHFGRTYRPHLEAQSII